MKKRIKKRGRRKRKKMRSTMDYEGMWVRREAGRRKK